MSDEQTQNNQNSEQSEHSEQSQSQETQTTTTVTGTEKSETQKQESVNWEKRYKDAQEWGRQLAEKNADLKKKVDAIGQVFAPPTETQDEDDLDNLANSLESQAGKFQDEYPDYAKTLKAQAKIAKQMASQRTAATEFSQIYTELSKPESKFKTDEIDWNGVGQIIGEAKKRGENISPKTAVDIWLGRNAESVFAKRQESEKARMDTANGARTLDNGEGSNQEDAISPDVKATYDAINKYSGSPFR